MNINEIADRAHYHAVKAGFYKDDAKHEIIEKISEESMELMSSIVLNHNCDIDIFERDVNTYNEKTFPIRFEKVVKNSIGDEMADNILLLLAASRELNIDIEKHITYKQKYNSLRDDHK